jgi:hypothetical protein
MRDAAPAAEGVMDFIGDPRKDEQPRGLPPDSGFGPAALLVPVALLAFLAFLALLAVRG